MTVKGTSSMTKKYIDIENLTQAELWLKKATHGEVACYHVGLLAHDRKSRDLNLIADWMWEQHVRGRVLLYQERLGDRSRYMVARFKCKA